MIEPRLSQLMNDNDITVINHPENLEIYLEHDSGWWDFPFKDYPEIVSDAKAHVLIFNGNPENNVLGENCSYITVESNYTGTLSPGQQKAYEVLLTLQESAIYSVTTMEKLAQSLGLDVVLAAGKRLEHLQTLKAISGFGN
ncbi:MAG: hypothetical protein AAGI69_21135 [Cyanobacteria bacterium P01_H01_bin.21]